jgi:hypothetical protein
VGTAGYEGHVLANGGKPPAQVPADPAGAHHCDPHGRSPLSLEDTRSRPGREPSCAVKHARSLKVQVRNSSLAEV